MELYKKYRPRTLKGMVGQDGPAAALQKLIDEKRIPHVLLFTGPSGCGKTTAARIVKDTLQCGEHDFVEMNCADFKGIEQVRDIRRHSGLQPMSGPVRVWMIDEAHKLTNDAQNAFLKILEDTPSYVYFLLATTDPQKLIKQIHTRSTEIRFDGLNHAALKRVVQRVVDKEQWKVSEEVVQEIAEASDNSARKALVILEQVGMLEGTDAQLAAVSAGSVDKGAAINLARELMNPRASWGPVAAILKDLKDEPESVRYLVLGYSRTTLLGGGMQAARAYKIIENFSFNFYDSKQAGLAAACWRVVSG